MAGLNNVIKAIEALKALQGSSSVMPDASVRKEKVSHCITIAEGVCNPAVKSTAKFPQVLGFSIETLLTLCDDAESDVRMVADECLNKIIRAMTDSNVVKVQIELYNEIKKNGSARSLRAALWRFAILSYTIRPTRGKAYVSNLIPCIVAIARRSEDSVIDTLSRSLPLILKTLGPFMSDNDAKTLLGAFFHNISSTQAAFRRAAANMILATCLNCRKPRIFLNYILNYFLDTMILASEDDDHLITVIGTFGCLRMILPFIQKPAEDQANNAQETENLLKIYELCIQYTKWHSDHNLVNAALETLAQFLQSPPKALVSILLSTEGISRSRITFTQNAARPSLSRMSTSTATTVSEENSDSTLNLLESDLPEIYPKIEKWIVDSETELPLVSSTRSNESPSSIFETRGRTLEDYSGLKIGTIENEEVEEGSDVGSEIEKTESLPYSHPRADPGREEECSEDASLSIASPKKLAGEAEPARPETDVGSFTDSDVPLKFCCRYLVSSFLLSGSAGQLIPDKAFRVSVKSLSLTCVAHMVKLYPDLLFMTVAKDSANADNRQTIADILLFANHPDPQIRGNVSMIVGCFLKAVFVQHGGCFKSPDADDANFKNNDGLLEDMTRLLLKGLDDDSASTCRQTLSALGLCLPELLESVDNKHGIALLTALPQLAKNPYFLVKVKLVDLLSELSYTTIEHITGGAQFQEHFTDVIVTLLGDQDQRVRRAASEGIVKSIPLLYFQHPQDDAVTRKATRYTDKFLSAVMSSNAELSSCQEKHKLFVSTFVRPFSFLNATSDTDYQPTIEYALSRVVNTLTETLATSSSRHLIFGCSEALFSLSEAYPTVIYVRGWDCILPKTLLKKTYKRLASRSSDSSENSFINDTVLAPVGSSLLSLALPLLSSSPISLDLSTHRHLILLAGNLASGLAVCNLKASEPAGRTDSDAPKLWCMFKDKQMHQHMELLLTHVARVLNIFVHVIDEVQLAQASARSALPSLPTAPTLSPKRKIAGEPRPKDRSERFAGLRLSKEHMGAFNNLPHYARMYDSLKAAHANYLVTLESEASEMYLSLLNATLDVLSQILEIATINEAGRIAEEILYYLQTTVALSATPTVRCVQQLLKCLFGTNVGALWSELDVQRSIDRTNGLRDAAGGFYNQCFQNPARQMADTIKRMGNNCRGENEPDPGWVGLLRRKGDRVFSSVFKGFARTSDQKASVASFIRLFEPMVIKSLKQYTITSSVSLQSQVLMLLSQLVQLRVNYCLLDSDKIFIGFVLKQFEFIEEGYVQRTEDLLPKMFNFLVHLSYEKNHSKVIIGVPKVIQLCDGLMASGQPALTHCIPALAPVVEDIFLLRNGTSNATEQRELETTKEVLISMLLRLVEYHQVIELLALCLTESRFSGDGNGEEKWRRWSRLTMDTVLPMLASGKVRVESERAHVALVKLFAAISPTVFRPVDPLLKVLFTAPASPEEPTLRLKRWLGMINVVLLSLISCAKEEAMLARLTDLGAFMTDLDRLLLFPGSPRDRSTDPLNALASQPSRVPPERTLARFIFNVIGVAGAKVRDLLGLIDRAGADPLARFSEYAAAGDDYLIHQFAFFLQLCIHMFESGSHCKVANATMRMIQGRDVPDDDRLPISDLNVLMLSVGNACPTLTCQWAYLMTLLGYNEMSFWSRVLGGSETNFTGRPAKTDDRTAGERGAAMSSVNLEIVRKGGIVLFCDYVCENLNDAEPLTWLLVNHIEEAVNFATESPVRDLLVAAVHRNPSASGLLVQAIATKCTDVSRPSFAKRLLQCVEGAHHSQSGAVIMTLVPRLLSTKYLALSRMAAKIASRRVETLLTLSADDAAEQLSKSDLARIMDTLHATRLARKHGGLVSLLNKLGVQLYDLSPLELDQRRPFNPAAVKSIQLDRNWFLSQVKLRCCRSSANQDTLDSARLLSRLELDDCLGILSCKEFDVRILKDCVTLGVRLSVERCQELAFGKGYEEKSFDYEASPLYVAAKQRLSEHVRHVAELLPKPHQVFDPLEHAAGGSSKELKYAARFGELMEDAVYWDTLLTIVPAVKVFVASLRELSRYNLAKIDAEVELDLAKFALLCLELSHWAVHADKKGARKLRPRDVEISLSCAAEILMHPGASRVFGDAARCSWVCSAAAALTRIVEHVLLTTTEPLPAIDDYALRPALRSDESRECARACTRTAVLVAWLERCQRESRPRNVPDYVFETIRELIVGVARLPLVNSYVLTPPLVWRHGWHAVGTGANRCHFPILSAESNLLQEVDILEQFVYRINLLGWTTRLQFEEIWMALLGVLNISQHDNLPPEEAAALVQSSSLAVQAITRLLLQTLLLPRPGNPAASEFIHHPRDPQLSVQKTSSQRLYAVQDLLAWKHECTGASGGSDRFKLDHIFCRGNIERVASSNRFSYSQLSVPYLWSSCNLYEDKLSASVLELKNRRNDALMSASLDLDSCLRFLVELYTSWMSPQANISIQLLTELVKSILAISELFVERSQYQWMLEVCLELSRNHPVENEILHQYLVVSVCKAAAVLTPLDFETLDKVKRLVDTNLKSGFLAARISALHGLLYLLQSAVFANCDETMNAIHPLAIEHIQKHIDIQDPNSVLNQSEEHHGMMWALVFFLLEHAEDAPPDTEAPAVLELVLSLVTTRNISSGLHRTLLQGLERLVATKSVIGKVAEQIVKVAIERLKQPSPTMALPALQLLLTCMYTEAADRLNQPEVEEPLPDIEPEALVRSIERTSAIFDRIKKGHPMEVEVLCTVLSSVLGDFFPPSDILTKVIGEFLSPQQPHPRLLSAVVFKVCERACTSAQMGLLQDWVVFSLPNFIQSLPIAMSVWCLSCFFISASTNRYLRALFPYVQSRIGKYEYEDKKMLCIAASDFYRKLPKETQQRAFVETFEAAAKEPDTPFSDILASL